MIPSTFILKVQCNIVSGIKKFYCPETRTTAVDRCSSEASLSQPADPSGACSESDQIFMLILSS